MHSGPDSITQGFPWSTHTLEARHLSSHIKCPQWMGFTEKELCCQAFKACKIYINTKITSTSPSTSVLQYWALTSQCFRSFLHHLDNLTAFMALMTSFTKACHSTNVASRLHKHTHLCPNPVFCLNQVSPVSCLSVILLRKKWVMPESCCPWHCPASLICILCSSSYLGLIWTQTNLNFRVLLDPLPVPRMFR